MVWISLCLINTSKELFCILHETLVKTEHITDVCKTSVNFKTSVPLAGGKKHTWCVINLVKCKINLLTESLLRAYKPTKTIFKKHMVTHIVEPGNIGNQRNEDQRYFLLTEWSLWYRRNIHEEEPSIRLAGPYILVLFKARWWKSGSLRKIAEIPILFVWGRASDGL